MRTEVRDPWGVRTALTARPLVTAGVATGVGLAFAKLVMSRKGSAPDAPTRLEYWAGKLLDGGIQVLKPLGRVYLRRWAAQFAPIAEGAESRSTAA